MENVKKTVCDRSVKHTQATIDALEFVSGKTAGTEYMTIKRNQECTKIQQNSHASSYLKIPIFTCAWKLKEKNTQKRVKHAGIQASIVGFTRLPSKGMTL